MQTYWCPHPGLICRATFTLNTYPKQWRDSNTIVLRKPVKPDYMLPNAHQPIVLLNTMAKILLACVADDLVQMAELHGLMPNTHFV